MTTHLEPNLTRAGWLRIISARTSTMRAMQIRPWLSALMMSAMTGCSVPVVGDLDSASPDAGLVDTQPADSDSSRAEGTRCDPQGDDTTCSDGLFCDANTKQCVECLVNVVRCSDSGQRERCEKPTRGEAGSVSGGFFYTDPCEPNHACVESPGEKTQCIEQVCEPLESRCANPLNSETCNGSGTAWLTSPCFAGKACYEGACEKVRHNVLIIFDTSGSMHQYIDMGVYPEFCEDVGLPCLAPWPDCDNPEQPLTAMTLAKEVFRQEIKAAVEGHVQFALQRFPQREALAQSPHCAYGLYSPGSVITGDDDSWDTSTASWFEAGLNEAVVVPFPRRVDGDNSEDLARWMNHSEQVGATDISCEVNSDCPTGLCGTVGGKKRCFFHKDPELRAGGETPLGKSLFYAGEYFRRFVAVDGRTCTSTKDCGSAGYVCADGGCEDPYAQCRDNHIIVFTDGGQNPVRQPNDFFHPVNQAKRLAFGLTCEEDVVCRGGALCHSGVCVTEEKALEDVSGYGTGGVSDALTTPDGRPLRIQVSVVNLQAHTIADNADIAMAGGGKLLDVTAQDPAAFGMALGTLLKYKLKCEPDDFF